MPDHPQAGLPVRAALHPTGLYLMQRPIPRAELTDPFLFETMRRLPGPDSIVHVPMDRIGRAPRHTQPAGLIFHMSRCGSTLLTQQLRQVPGLTVYSEPQAVNEILVPPHAWPRPALIAALRTLAGALAAHAGGPYVIKFSSWNTLFCDILADAFPDAPWAFSWRDPLEVAASLTRNVPGWFKGDEGTRLRKIVDPSNAATTPEDHTARAVAALCSAGAALTPGRGRLIPYEALPAVTWETLAPHFGQRPDATTIARMTEAATRNAKAPTERFVADSTAKRTEASPELRQAIDRHARPALEKLLARHG